MKLKTLDRFVRFRLVSALDEKEKVTRVNILIYADRQTDVEKWDNNVVKGNFEGYFISL